MLYIMPETFIKIDSLSHLEISRQTNLAYEPAKTPRYKIHCYDVMLFFFILVSTMHTSMAGTFQCEYCQWLRSHLGY